MNDEIKEILDKLKIKSDRYNHHLKYNISYENKNEDYEAYLLLDYITNLQQERDTYYSIVSQKSTKEIDYQRLNELQQENERLKEYIRIANVSEWFKGNDSLEKLLQNNHKDDKKVISKADFNKVWSESTTEDILNQFYYEHNDLRELLKENGNKEGVITQLTNQLKEFKEEHKIMKQILIENGLWERLLNDDRFLKYLRDDEE